MDKHQLKIVKIGGNIINNEGALNLFLEDFAQLKGPKILVHGGGKKANEISEAMGLKPKMIGGRRVTDKPTLDIVTMVYAGLLNKKITALLQKYGCQAIGLTGADANCIRAHKRIVDEIDYGYAGDIDAVNRDVIEVLLQKSMSPVFCAITHDKNGQLLNTNADTIASEVAIAMSSRYKSELNYVFELKGVLRHLEDKDSVIAQINFEKYKQLVDDGVISEGMLPKLHNCFNALKKGVYKVHIGDASLVKKSVGTHTTLSL